MSRTGEAPAAECCTYSVFDALAIGLAVKSGEAVLLGPVIFHREPVNVSVYWRPVQGTAEAMLQKHHKRLTQALQHRLHTMEQENFDGWTEAKTDAFCAKYNQYKTLLEACK